MKLLVFCPSRARPDRLMSMVRTFCKTIDFSHTDLLVLLDKDDDCLEEYLDRIPRFIKFRIFDRTGDKTFTTEILNRAFKIYNDYDFYSVTNDDIQYETLGWDVTLCNKGKISTGVERNMVKKYGKKRHGIDIEGFPIFSVIDGDICRALGWVQLPELIHSCGDNVWYWIARRMNILEIHKDIFYIHKSYYFKDGEEDATFKRTNVRDSLRNDANVYTRWVKYEINNAIVKIKEKICLRSN